MTKYELLKKMREEIDEFENEIESKYKDIE